MTKWNICQFFINNFYRLAPEGNIVRLRLACGITGKNEGIPVITSMPERADKPLWDVAVWECPSGTMMVCLAKKQKGDLMSFLCTGNRYFFFRSLQDREKAMFCVCAGIGSVFGKAQSRFLRKKWNGHVISTPKAMRTVLIAQRGKNRKYVFFCKNRPVGDSRTAFEKALKHGILLIVAGTTPSYMGIDSCPEWSSVEWIAGSGGMGLYRNGQTVCSSRSTKIERKSTGCGRCSAWICHDFVIQAKEKAHLKKCAFSSIVWWVVSDSNARPTD